MLQFKVKYVAKNRTRTVTMSPEQLLELCRRELFENGPKVVDFNIKTEGYLYGEVGGLGTILVDGSKLTDSQRLSLGTNRSFYRDYRSQEAPPIATPEELEPLLIYETTVVLNTENYQWWDYSPCHPAYAYGLIYKQYNRASCEWIDQVTVVYRYWRDKRLSVHGRFPVDPALVDRLKQEFEDEMKTLERQASDWVDSVLATTQPTILEELDLSRKVLYRERLTRALRAKDAIN